MCSPLCVVQATSVVGRPFLADLFRCMSTGHSQIVLGSEVAPTLPNEDTRLEDYSHRVEAALAMANVKGAQAAAATSSVTRSTAASRSKQAISAYQYAQGPSTTNNNSAMATAAAPSAKADPDFSVRRMSWGGGPSSIVFGTYGIDDEDGGATKTADHRNKQSASEVGSTNQQPIGTTVHRKSAIKSDVGRPAINTSRRTKNVQFATTAQSPSVAVRSPLADRSWGGGRTSLQVVGSGMETSNDKTTRAELLSRGRQRQRHDQPARQTKGQNVRGTSNSSSAAAALAAQKQTVAPRNGPRSGSQAQRLQGVLKKTQREAWRNADKYGSDTSANIRPAAKRNPKPQPQPQRQSNPPPKSVATTGSRSRPKGHAKLTKHHSWGGGPSSFSSMGDFGGSSSSLAEAPTHRSGSQYRDHERGFDKEDARNDYLDTPGDYGRYHELCDEIQMLESKIGGIGVHLPDHKRHELKKVLAKKRVTLRRMVGK